MNYQMNLSTSTCVKPVFVARVERERLALERKQEQAGKQRHLGGQEQDRVIERRKRKGEEYDNAREQERFEKLQEEEEKKREKEVEFIKEQYLGSKKAKRYVAKPSDKSRFSSDWENSADTSRDLASVYQTPRDAQLLFGRGFRAGIDRREQKRHGVDDPDAKFSRNHQAAAISYETFDMRNADHWSNKKLAEMTERDWRIFKEDTDISYKGSRIPDPMRNWEESNLSSELLRAVIRQGFTTPSPIQMAAIPVGLQQRDVIGVAETGSGKTAAFVLPMLSYIASLPPITEMNKADGPYALVLAPTRELAQQIKDETLKLAHYMGVKVLCIVGGESIEEQAFNITQGCEIVIATPNRLLHCLGSRFIVLNQCNYIVLDEADRMIDFGFEQQIAGILDAMPSCNLKPENADEVLERKKIYRTTYMFSATMSSSVERLAKKYLRNPVVITIGTAGKATDRITQNVIMIEETKKMSKLLMLLDDLCESRAIVFVNTKVQAITLAKQLDRAGYKVTALHGKNSQQQRQISLDGFRSRRYNVLVATDVAARGLDIPDVAHVINYDAPWTIEMYTHRIGRTGRAGKTGVATTFLTSKDTDLFFDLKQMLIQSNCPVPPQLARHEASKFKPRFTPGKPSGRSATAFGHY